MDYPTRFRLLIRVHEDNLALRIYIKHIRSSNGTSINSERISGEGLESQPFEPESDDLILSRFPPVPNFMRSCTTSNV